MTSTLQPRSISSDRIIVKEIETETLLYDERTHRAWCLNQSSACIWRLCDGRRTVQQIAEAAGSELGSYVNEDLVLLALTELREKELLEEPSAALLPDDISRRAMIGRAGLAAAALLPVIAAITAPTAAAQLGGSAGTGGDGGGMSSHTDPARVK
ncbi:MAG TPA: PqqD family protein [Acidobacteriaceae bacterium]|nr:PqqD family protein [Acidobacteriaceae bacterium]